MQMRQFGKTGLTASALGFGCWAIGGHSYGPTNDAESVKALSYAYDCGINFFDTADIYGEGHSESLVGTVFSPSSKRTQVILATKCGWDFYQKDKETDKNFSPEYISFACDKSLKRLNTDYIDLYQLHNPTIDIMQHADIFKALDRLKKQGKIRFYGISVHTIEEAEFAISSTNASSVQLVVNLIEQEPITSVFEKAEQQKTAIIAREPLACGLLTGKCTPRTIFHKSDHRNRWPRDRYLKLLDQIAVISKSFDTLKTPLTRAAVEFVIAFSAVSVVIPGMKTIQQVQDHLNAINLKSLSEEEVGQIQETYLREPIFHQASTLR